MNETTGLASEANVFALHPKGFEVHFKLMTMEAAKIIGNMDTLVAGLMTAGYLPSSRPGKGNGGPPAQQQGESHGQEADRPRRGRNGGRNGRTASSYRGEVYSECPWCGEDVYDNRQKKANEPNWRGPWFKCKAGDDCGFVVFKNDGTTGD